MNKHAVVSLTQTEAIALLVAIDHYREAETDLLKDGALTRAEKKIEAAR